MKNVMEFTATLELSAPKDVSKMYNFVSIRGVTGTHQKYENCDHLIIFLSTKY